MRGKRLVLILTTLIAATNVHADDWPLLGRDKTRNPVSAEKNPPLWWQVPITEGDQRAAAKNIKWHVAPPNCSRLSGDPVIANGMVWIGYRERGEKPASHASVLACYREKDGKPLYQFRTPDTSKVGFSAAEAGQTSSPLIEGDRLWFTTPACESVCLDIGPLRCGDGQPK